MPAVSSSPLLWETVSWRQLSTILYKCLGTTEREEESRSSDGPRKNQTAGAAAGRAAVYQASMSWRFTLSLSKLRPDSFWQRMYLQEEAKQNIQPGVAG